MMPFPLDALPVALRDLVVEGAAAMVAPPDFIAVPLLVASGHGDRQRPRAGAEARLDRGAEPVRRLRGRSRIEEEPDLPPGDAAALPDSRPGSA